MSKVDVVFVCVDCGSVHLSTIEKEKPVPEAECMLCGDRLAVAAAKERGK